MNTTGKLIPRGEQLRGAPRAPFDEARRNAIITENPVSIADVWEFSPHRFEDNDSHAELIVDALFRGDSLLLCVGRSRSQFETRRRKKLRGRLGKMQFIVPNPMTAALGRTRAGKRSAHTLANTGERRFVVAEFDNGTIDDQAATIWHLAFRAPLTLMVHSGGKSLQAWFYCRGQAEERVRGFFEYAVTIGADPATWTRSQFVRMPDGLRDNGQRQVAYYLNPATVKQ